MKTDLKQLELNMSEQTDIIENNKPNAIITEADQARMASLVDDSESMTMTLELDPQRNQNLLVKDILDCQFSSNQK